MCWVAPPAISGGRAPCHVLGAPPAISGGRPPCHVLGGPQPSQGEGTISDVPLVGGCLGKTPHTSSGSTDTLTGDNSEQTVPLPLRACWCRRPWDARTSSVGSDASLAFQWRWRVPKSLVHSHITRVELAKGAGSQFLIRNEVWGTKLGVCEAVESFQALQ